MNPTFGLIATLLVVSVVSSRAQSECGDIDVLAPKSLSFLGNEAKIQINDPSAMTISYHSFGPLVQGGDSSSNTHAPLLLVNGFGATQYDWDIEFLETLAQYRQVVIFDNPRIGMTTDNDTTTPLSIEYMTNATLAFIQALQLDTPDILGYSMGGDIVLTLAAKHNDSIGSVVAVASSFGGPQAPQPDGGLQSALTQLQTIFLIKYASYFNAPAASSLAITPTTPTAGNNSNNNHGVSAQKANITADPFTLFFPLGAMDPAFCQMVGDMNSLMYAVGVARFDQFNYTDAGYAVPSIIPSISAVLPTNEAMTQQLNALVNYYRAPNGLPALLNQTTNQILFISGVQDTVIPINTQVQAAHMAPGAWLIQIPDAGHALPYVRPTEFSTLVTTFFDNSQALDQEQMSYYAQDSSPPASSAAVKAMFAGLGGVTVASVLTAMMVV